MAEAGSSGRRDRVSVKALERRARDILKARPAYKEMVDFYLTVFRLQIEWRDRLVVHPDEVGKDQSRECLAKGKPLSEQYDPGIDVESLVNLWTQMKGVFRHGNEVLLQAIDMVEEAESSGDFVPATWLPEQRPDRAGLVADAAGEIGVDESVLATLARAVTYPHWEVVADSWLPEDRVEGWKGFRCPACGGAPGLVELRTGTGGGDRLQVAAQRVMHCPFCGMSWEVPALECPSCGSTKSGDAKYFFTTEEPDLRIDFCESCHHYVKVVNGDKVSGPIHVGLELLAATHLDVIAQDKNLSPLEVCA